MFRRTLFVALCAILFAAGGALAQDQGQGQGGGGDRGDRRRGEGGGGGPGGGPGGFDPAQWQQRRMDMIREQLSVNDEEWGVLSPKIERVVTTQRDVGRMGFGFGRRGGGGGPGAAGAEQSAVGRAMQDLRDTLGNADASAETIGQKLTALREARTKAAADFAAAQAELKEVLTQRQEAVLVMMSLLE